MRRSVSDQPLVIIRDIVTGALIAPSWLVTTASCSYADNTKVAATKVRAVLGEETLGGAGDFFQVSSVTKIVTHPDYDSSSATKTDNIALWKLSSPVSTDTYTRLCLPSQVIVTVMSLDVTRIIAGGPGRW